MHTNTLEKDWKFKWILWAQYFLALGVLSSPTIVSLFHIIIIIPFFALVAGKERLFLPKSSIVLLALFSWGMISTIYNFSTVIKPVKSFNDLKYYLLAVLLFIPLNYFYKRAENFNYRRLLNIFWFVIIIGFFVGLSRAWWHFDPVKMQFTDKYHPNRSGGFLNYMRYGYASAFVVILGLSMHLNREKIKGMLNYKLFYSAWFLSFMAIFTSKTRGALLAVLVGVPIVLLKYKPKLAKGIIALGIIFVSIVLYFTINKNAPSRFFNINGSSNKVRMTQFESAYMAAKENPILGLGADQFSYNSIPIKKKYNIPHQEYSGHAHNIFLEHAADFGIVGMILFMLFLLFWFIEMFQMKTAFSWAIVSYIIAYTISGQVELLLDNANSHILFYIYTFSQVMKLNNKGVTHA